MSLSTGSLKALFLTLGGICLRFQDSGVAPATGRARLIRSHSSARIKWTYKLTVFELTEFELTMYFKHEMSRKHFTET